MNAVARPSLGAQVVRRTVLLYREGADAALDRPPHVRAGSALTALPGGKLAVFQDDALFVGIIHDGDVHGIALPAIDGARVFDDRRGNKKRKLDLEASIVHDEVLVAFGSGSTPTRENVVLVDAAHQASIVHARGIYALMRAEPRFSGSELNVEGAAIDGPDVVFFNRGNGAGAAVDATCRVDLAALYAYLRDQGPCPPLRDVAGWDLGAHDGVRLTFTDGAMSPRGLAFLACAEACASSILDGPVSYVALGRIDDRAGTCAYGAILDEHGALLLDKAEGLSFDASDPKRAFVVVDKDDPEVPSELLELRLGEGWQR